LESKGVLYVATGEKCLKEALTSARSLKACMPEMPVTLFTDQAISENQNFDRIIPVPDPEYSYIDKIAPLKNSPYDHTLFIDSDTYICEKFDELFELLDRFDIAAAHDTWSFESRVDGCPEPFLELNTGVLLYQRIPKVNKFINEWLSEYKMQRQLAHSNNDQAAFRKCIYHSRISLYILPPEYNYMVWYPGFSRSHGRVKILHGRSPFLSQTAKWINQSRSARVFLPSAAYMNESNFNIFTQKGRLLVKTLGFFVGIERLFRKPNKTQKSTNNQTGK